MQDTTPTNETTPGSATCIGGASSEASPIAASGRSRQDGTEYATHTRDRFRDLHPAIASAHAWLRKHVPKAANRLIRQHDGMKPEVWRNLIGTIQLETGRNAGRRERLAQHRAEIRERAGATPETLPGSESDGPNPEPDPPAPPTVIRGAKCHTTGRIDWWAGSTPDIGELDEVTRMLGERFGPWRVERGLNRYAERREFNNGAKINYTAEGMAGNAGLHVELPGAALGVMTVTQVLELLRPLDKLLRCSRIDLALDYRGEAVPLIDLATASARRGELCRCRRWKPVEEYAGSERIAYGINFGKRGKDGSGRYMRWYDKGLETGEAPEGQWVRLEAELSGGVAVEASAEVLAADEPTATLAGITLGCVDFRENTGDAHLDRRPRLAWWSEVLAGISTIRITAPRKSKTLENYGAWIRTSVFPGLSDMAKLTGQTVAEVLDDLSRGFPSIQRKPPELNPVAWAYAQSLRRRAAA